MRSRSKERLGDNLSMRLSREMRDFLNRIAEEQNVAIGEAVRICISSKMARPGRWRSPEEFDERKRAQSEPDRIGHSATFTIAGTGLRT